jgi:hypothetical protein
MKIINPNSFLMITQNGRFEAYVSDSDAKITQEELELVFREMLEWISGMGMEIDAGSEA